MSKATYSIRVEFAGGRMETIENGSGFTSRKSAHAACIALRATDPQTWDGATFYVVEVSR